MNGQGTPVRFGGGTTTEQISWPSGQPCVGSVRKDAFGIGCVMAVGGNPGHGPSLSVIRPTFLNGDLVIASVLLFMKFRSFEGNA